MLSPRATLAHPLQPLIGSCALTSLISSKLPIIVPPSAPAATHVRHAFGSTLRGAIGKPSNNANTHLLIGLVPWVWRLWGLVVGFPVLAQVPAVEMYRCVFEPEMLCPT